VNVVRAVTPRTASVDIATDPDLVARYLEDAAHYPGGRAPGVVRPQDAAEVAAAVRGAATILPIGAQSSLTGGATPAGDIVLSTERLARIDISAETVVAGAGVTLHELQDALAVHQKWLPPVPTYLGATVGGAVSTNAAGAATFKYGPMRPWVHALTVVLPCGDIVEVARGDVIASDEGTFVVETSAGTCTVRVPDLRMPDVPKRSAGYHSAPGMDLVDLFIGAEGTLGVIVDVVLRVQPRPAGVCWALIPLATESAAIELTAALREAAAETWRTSDPRGIDVSAIEHIDRRSLDVVREDGVDRRLAITVAREAGVVLLAQLELSAAFAARDLWRDLENALSAEADDAPLTRLCRLLDRHGALHDTELALPTDSRRAAAFVELREAVPAGVNRRVSLARAADARIHKTAADMIVPYEQFARMMRACREMCAAANLDLAVWGHISDGNVHPNIIPRSYDDMQSGRAMLVELARLVIDMGGCPLAEHGVGRNPVKQALLRMLYGESGVDAMRQTKLSLDPEWKLAPGVLFPAPNATS
jgi:D-lactate dehydrogenase (cytochrome)